MSANMFDWLNAKKPKTVVLPTVKKKRKNKPLVFAGIKASPGRIRMYRKIHVEHTKDKIQLKKLYTIYAKKMGLGIGSIRAGYESWRRAKGVKDE